MNQKISNMNKINRNNRGEASLESLGFIIIVSLVLVIGIFKALTFVQKSTAENMEIEAVKHHAGKWIVNERGEAKFYWNDELPNMNK